MPPSPGKVVVTGGAGFIGSHLVDRLLGDGHRHVVVFDDFSRGRLSNLARHADNPALEVVTGDVRDAAHVGAALRGAAVVFHLAARRGPSGVTDDHGPAADEVDGHDETFTTNVIGTVNVLRGAVLAGARRVVFVSSQEVYGEPVALPVDEDHPLMATSLYGASKAAGEAYCRAFRRVYGLTTVVLRLAHVYGPRDTRRPIAGWLEQASAEQALSVRGGRQLMDLVWIEQVVDALVRVAATDGALPPINVASGTGTRAADLARRIARLAQGQPAVQLLPGTEAGAPRFVASVERMRAMLKIEPPLDPLAYLPRLFPAPPAAAAGLATSAGGTAHVRPA
jgi:UDP-glucose 4-epimerase